MRSTPKAGKRGLWRAAAALAALVIVAGVVATRMRDEARTIAAPPESEIELTLGHEGATYKIDRVDIYTVGPEPGRLTFVERLYDPNFFARNYAVVEGVPHKRDPETGKLYPTRRTFKDDFEDAAGLEDLIGPRRGWTSFTLQSPRAPTVPEYNALRQRLLSGRGDFLDNRVEVSRERAHSGSSSLKCVSVPPSRGMVTAKASLWTSLLHFVKGDDVWASGCFLVPEGSSPPFTLLDLESTWIKEQPGMRIVLDPPGHLMLELKWADKPKYRQAEGREVRFPVGKWVEVRLHLRLSDEADGLAELWQDGVKVVEGRGRTLPLAGTIYDDLEVGISAHSFGPGTAVLYVDDVTVSTDPSKISIKTRNQALELGFHKQDHGDAEAMSQFLTLLIVALTTVPVRAEAGPKVAKDIAYSEAGGDRTRLDVYAPGDGKDHPVVVWVHGGAWQFGDKAHVKAKPGAFQVRGYVLVSVNYRFRPAVTYKEQAGDIAQAVRWVHGHAEEYGGDPGRLFLTGHSSGAHLAALVGTDDRYLKEAGLTLGDLAGVVLLDGAGYDIPQQVRQSSLPRMKAMYTTVFTDDEPTQKDASPVTHVAKGKGTPPFLILHVASRRDSKAQSEGLAAKLREAGVEATVVPAEGKTHATINRELGQPDDAPTKAVFEFLRGQCQKPSPR